MKKLVKILLGFTLVFAFVAALFGVTKANADLVTSDKIVVNGAQIRTDEKAGFRFVGSVKDYEVPAGKTIAQYGFVLVVGEEEASEEFVIGGKLEGNRGVGTIRLEQLADETEKTFLCTIFNIPASDYGTNLSARAFVVLDDDTVVYGAESTVRSLAKVALAVVEEGGEIPPFVDTVVAEFATGYKKYFLDSLGSFYVDGSVYESDPAKLYKAFAADWNAYVTDEAKKLNVDATRAEMGPALTTALNGGSEFSYCFDEESGDVKNNIVGFFNDVKYKTKWSFLLDLFYGAGAGEPEAEPDMCMQIAAIKACDKDFVITKNQWYNAFNLITYMADFFAQNSYSAFPNAELMNIHGILWVVRDSDPRAAWVVDGEPEHDYRTFFADTEDLNAAVEGVLADGANVVSVGDKIKLPATAPITGYEGYYVLTLNGDEYEVGDEYVVTDDDVQFLCEYRLVDYTITYNLNGGTNHADNPAGFTYETADIVLKDATKAGYSFAGWYSDAEFTTKVEKIAKHTAQNVVLYAKWDLKDFNITYKFSEETGVTNDPANPTTINTETEVTLKDATKTGYTFIGWYSNSDYAEEHKYAGDKIPTGVVSDITVYGKFIETEYKKYFVDFMGNVYLDDKKFESNPAELFKVFATDWNTFVGANAENKIDVDASREEIGVEMKDAMIANIIFKTNDDLVKFFNTDPYKDKWSWILDMFADAAATPAFEDPSLINQVAAIKSNDADFAITKNDWYCGVNLITYMSDYFSQTDYSAFPPVEGNNLHGIVWHDHDLGIDNRPFFANVLAYNNKIEAVNPVLKEKFADIKLPDYDTGLPGISAYYTLGVGGTRYDVDDEYEVGAGNAQFLIEFDYTNYTITYKMPEGATNDANNPATFRIIDTVNLKAATLTGYTFEGWYKEDTFATKVEKINEGTHENQTLYAKFTLTDYTITYNLNGGTNAAANPATFKMTDEDITLANPTKTGGTFKGWFKEAGFVNEVTKIAKGTHENVTLYAKWDLTVYNITYALDGGTNDVNNPATYTCDSAFEFKAASKVGYTFVKWVDANNQKVEKVVAGTTGDLDLTAVFELATYTITYNLNGGTNAEANPATFQYTSAAIEFADATKTGYDFAGWYAENTFVTPVAGVPTHSSANVVVYAKFVNYAINYVLDGGTNSAKNPATRVKAEAVTFEDASKAGYEFNGWFAEDTFENAVLGVEANTTADVTVYAKFTALPHAITFDFNDSTATSKIKSDFIADTQAAAAVYAEYEAGFLTHDAKNEYYYDYLPLRDALENSAAFRTKWAWLFDAIADAHANVSENYVEGIRAFKEAGIYNADSIYVFCQELKAYFGVAADPNYVIVGYTNVQLEEEAIYDWASDEQGLFEQISELSETPSVVHNIATDVALNTVIADPVRAGYEFAGWNTAADGTGTTYTKAPAEDTTLYAIWTPAA